MFLKTTSILIFFLSLIASPVSAAKYHIDPDIAKSGDGTAQSPFKSWWNLPNLQIGDDVYFKCDTVFNASYPLNINWEGTSSNPVVVGAYYLDGSQPVYSVKGERPIISGMNFTVPSNVCQSGTSDRWKGLIEVNNKKYIHIKNLHIYRSGWAGIHFNGDLNSYSSNIGLLIDGCKIEGSYYTGIWVNASKHCNGIISRNEVTLANAAWGMLKESSGDRCDSSWGAGIAVTNTPYANITIKNNYVHEQWGEGISSTRVLTGTNADHCGYVTIEDNVVFNNRRVDIYINLTEGNTVRRNILLGVNDSAFMSAYSDNRNWNQRGIWVNNEYRAMALPNACHDNQIYSNIVAGHYVGIGLSSYYTNGTMNNQVFYNNTVIANKINFDIDKNLSTYNTNNIFFKNNISYCPADTICIDVNTDPTWFDSKIIADYNAWTKKPVNWGGNNDLLTNNYWLKVNGWQALSEIPNISSFSPVDGNPVIGSGVYLPTPYNVKIITENTNDITSPSGITFNSITLNADNNIKWDMGAIQTVYDYIKLDAPILSIMEVQ